jgi:hypothetical protein
MTTAIAAFLKVYDHDPVPGDPGIRLQWQNFFVGQNIDGYAFKPFTVSEIVMNRAADEGGLQVEMPCIKLDLDFFRASLDAERLLEVVLYEMNVDSGIPGGIGGATVVSRFVGEIISISTDLVKIELDVGAAIDAISGEIPGRRVTTSVVGRLPTL